MALWSCIFCLEANPKLLFFCLRNSFLDSLLVWNNLKLGVFLILIPENPFTDAISMLLEFLLQEPGMKIPAL